MLTSIGPLGSNFSDIWFTKFIQENSIENVYKIVAKI